MKAFLKKYRFVILLIAIFLLIAAFLLVKKNQSPAPSPTPTPTPLQLVQFYPSQGEQEIAVPLVALAYTFSTPVDSSTANIIISPFVGFELSTDASGKILYITPTAEWKYDTLYKVTITISSKEGVTLSTPVEHSFLFKKVSKSNFDENWAL
ncbi:MAG TPA: Ig-like domain-containing protein [Patescibacteria group bacterium]|uniref:SbsA Ig-like domain-containing protein n=1 Tax=Candidatus Woesebacteria bacterium RBG_13_46_13 TaxID=1802479 RepID=A0A1F7X4Z5_9BACT|nr:MAG: hypothetical protein A2Y68_01895 [Candidatus Woesebacteria bacterium RBG_13_46_13]HJX59336.1 Ig-like domain-containing protein [Patescibacteria group bacterium]